MMVELREKITGIIGNALLDASTKVPNEIVDKILTLLPQWISVEDGLPEDIRSVIVFNGRRVTTGSLQGIHYKKPVWCNAIGHLPNIGPPIKITHWMPLPQPPKETP